MKLVALYEIRCPNGHTIELPETILEGIIRHLQASYTGEPVLNFVCSVCKTAFHFDYPNRVRVGQTDAPRHLSEFHVLSVQSGCEKSYCGDHVVLVAVRSRDMSEQSILLETIEWDVSAITCKRGYHARPIGAPKHPGLQFFV
jgi:hypothetical protein